MANVPVDLNLASLPNMLAQVLQQAAEMLGGRIEVTVRPANGAVPTGSVSLTVPVNLQGTVLQLVAHEIVEGVAPEADLQIQPINQE